MSLDVLNIFNGSIEAFFPSCSLALSKVILEFVFLTFSLTKAQS